MNNDSFIDYYKILQVDRNAAQEVITVSYKSLAKKYHPDLNLNNLDEANEKMKAINEAYRILNDGESRRKYNLTYDSYIKTTINNSTINSSSTNDSSINNTHNSYMTRKSRREASRKENIKISSFLDFKKRNTVIASIIAILFLFIVAGKIIISSDNSSASRVQNDNNTNIRQTDRMRDNLDNNRLNNSDNNSGRPDRRGNSSHDMQWYANQRT